MKYKLGGLALLGGILFTNCQQPTSNLNQALPSVFESRSECPPSAIIIVDRSPSDKMAMIELDNYCVNSSFNALSEALSASGWIKYEPDDPLHHEMKKILEDLNISTQFPATDWHYKHEAKKGECDLFLHLSQNPTKDWAPSENHSTFVRLMVQNCEAE